MSFIYDKKLSSYLEQVGQEFLEKYGQAAQKPNIQSAFNVAKNLFLQLEQEIKSVDDNFAVPTGKEIAPSMNDLNSLDHLTGFLAANLITYNNKPIAKGQYFNDKMLGPQGAIGQDYQIDKDGLKQYILKLREDSTSSENKLFILLVGKIIKEANKKYSFGIQELNAEIAKTEKSIENTDDFQLDTLPKLFDPKNNPLQQGFDKKLLGRDLNSTQSISSWIRGQSQNSGPEMQLVDEKTKQPKDVKLSDMCNILNALFKRAQAVDNNDLAKSSDKYKKIYIDKLNKLSGSYNCKLDGATSSISQDSSATSKQNSGNANLNSVIDSISSNLPLGSPGPNAIDLRRIKKFIDVVKGQIAPAVDSIKELNGLNKDDLTRWSNATLLFIDEAAKKEVRYPWNFNSQTENQNHLEEIFGSQTEAIKGSNALTKIILNVGEILSSLYECDLGMAIKSKLDHQYNTLSRNYLSQLQRIHAALINSK